MVRETIYDDDDIYNCYSVYPNQSIVIDADWIKEKNIEMDIILPFKNEVPEEENIKKSNDNKKWNDIGLEELLKRELDQNDLVIK